MPTDTDKHIEAIRKLSTIGAMIQTIFPAPQGRYAIWIKERKLRLSVQESLSKDAVVICTISGSQINNGMSSKEWETIASKIFEAIKEGRL